MLRSARGGLALLVAAFVSTGVAGCSRLPSIDALVMERVERPAFGVLVPANGEVVGDEATPGRGRYILRYGGMRPASVTIQWAAHEATSEDFVALRSMAAGIGSVLEEETSLFAGGDRLLLLIEGDAGRFVVSSTSRCRENSVMITLTTSVRGSRIDNAALHRRMLDSFECLGDTPIVAGEIVVPQFDASGFGYLGGKDQLVLIRNDERAMLFVGSHPAGAWTKSFRERPELLRATLSWIGKASPRSSRADKLPSPAGDLWVYELTVEEPESSQQAKLWPDWAVVDVTLAAFDCPQQERGYNVTYLAPAGAAKGEARAVLQSFDCPATPPRQISDLPTACDVGVASACEGTDPGRDLGEPRDEAEACRELADRMASRGLEKYAAEIRGGCPEQAPAATSR